MMSDTFSPKCFSQNSSNIFHIFSFNPNLSSCSNTDMLLTCTEAEHVLTHGQANVTVEPVGLSEDGLPSAVINYGVAEQLLTRPLRDEIRRVRTLFLSLLWFTYLLS
jgi:hypothetical protein